MLIMLKAIALCMIILKYGTAHIPPDVEYSADVVVLGAGMSGIAAAQRLKELNRDLKVLVLEGTDRIGGRVKEGYYFQPSSSIIILQIGG